MKLCAMRFNGYTWHHNPKKLEISNGKKVVSLDVPYAQDILQNFGEKPVRIKGSGELYGEDCLQQYERLLEVYQKQQSAILCLPQLAPIYAYFESLTVNAQTMPDVLTYNFVFLQTKQKPQPEKFERVVKAQENETLWDIAYKYSVSIEDLVKLNPQIMFINDLSQGELVRLC